jgi:predicted AAA+ superfamily ATPase
MTALPPTAPLERLLAPLTREAIETMPVVVITGARQTGKSTLARQLAQEMQAPYLSLDDIDVRERALATPAHFVREAPRMVIDEVQRAPELILAIKRAVDDADQRAGQFVLTGSANLLMMKQVADSLAGRALYVQMAPLTRSEQLGLGSAGIWSQLVSTPNEQWPELIAQQTAPQESWQDLVMRGGFPRPAYHLKTARQRTQWYSAYIETYLERDLRDLAAVDNILDFRRLMRAACLRLGALVNQTELGRDVQLAKTTVHRYLNLMETSYQLVRLEPYSVNHTLRLIKTPKVYWNDSALAMHLADETTPRGAHLENLVLSDLISWRGASIPRPEVLFWRTTSGVEVDFVIEHGATLLPIEVKSGTTLRSKDAAPLNVFLKEYSAMAPGGIILYSGARIFWITPRVLAVPWWKVI